MATVLRGLFLRAFTYSTHIIHAGQNRATFLGDRDVCLKLTPTAELNAEDPFDPYPVIVGAIAIQILFTAVVRLRYPYSCHLL